MDPQLDPRRQRQLFLHTQRQNTSDLWARGRKSANDQHDLELKPVPMFLKNGSIVLWPWVRRPVRDWF
jgi:hypothetical protein